VAESQVKPVTLERVACAVCGSDAARTARVRAPRDDHALDLGMPAGRSVWVVCEHCGLVYQSPRPTSAVVQDLYAGGDYHKVRGGLPEHYVQYSLRRSSAVLAWGLSQPEVDVRGRAVDIGCGVGGALVWLRDRGWEVVGVEPDASLVEIARVRFGLEVYSDFFSEETFSSCEGFNLAFSSHVWEHLADPRATCVSAQRVLVDQRGHLLIVVPTFRRARTLAWSSFTVPHTYMFTEVSLGNLLRASGFDVVAHRYAAGADSELWLLARATVKRSQQEAVVVEDVRAVQRELATVPLRVPLGLVGRLPAHARTLVSDPKDFLQRFGRWSRGRLGRARAAIGGWWV
jgi:SAM-dependent methyltransferase